MADYKAIRKDLYERFHDAFEKLYISELKDQIADKDEIITANDHVIAEQQAEIERLRADLEAADIAVSRLNGSSELQMLMRENNKLRACLVDIATGQVIELPFIQALSPRSTERQMMFAKYR